MYGQSYVCAAPLYCPVSYAKLRAYKTKHPTKKKIFISVLAIFAKT